jgi:ElaB/YqjD/DUF883 family membrane-anchored ribosome-binding protein
MNPTAENADRIHSSVDRLTRSAHQAVDRVAERAGPAIDQVRGAAERATEAVGTRLDHLSTMQEEWADTMRDRVRERPLVVLGLAVLTGLLIGRLMR